MAGISREKRLRLLIKFQVHTQKQQNRVPQTMLGLESKKAIAANGSNVTQKKNNNGEVVSKQTTGTNQDNNSSNNSITNTTNDK